MVWIFGRWGIREGAAKPALPNAASGLGRRFGSRSRLRGGRRGGLRLNGGRTFSLDSWARFGEAWINGVRSRTFAADTVCVAAFTLNESITQKTAVGNYWGDSRYDRTWWGDIAEIVCATIARSTPTNVGRSSATLPRNGAWRCRRSPYWRT